MQLSSVLKVAVTTAAFIVIALPGVASADERAKLAGKSEKVTYADLNVRKETGARQLYRRLQRASKRVCGVESISLTGSLSEASRAKHCYRKSLDTAVVEIDQPVLTKIHKG